MNSDCVTVVWFVVSLFCTRNNHGLGVSGGIVVSKSTRSDHGLGVSGGVEHTVPI